MTWLSAVGSDGAPGTTEEDGQQQHVQVTPPASGMAALARQLAQAKLSEAELEQMLRYALPCKTFFTGATCLIPLRIRNTLKVCMCPS